MLEAEFLNEAVLGGAACTGKSSRVLVDVPLLSVSPPWVLTETVALVPVLH